MSHGMLATWDMCLRHAACGMRVASGRSTGPWREHSVASNARDMRALCPGAPLPRVGTALLMWGRLARKWVRERPSGSDLGQYRPEYLVRQV